MWHDEMTSMPKLRTYVTFKSLLEPEKYLSCVYPAKFRISLSKFRCASHKYNIETGRHNNIPEAERLCNFCISQNIEYIENEYHFLAICPQYQELRNRFLPPWFIDNPTYNKFVSLLCTTNTFYLNQLANYVYHAMKCRDWLIHFTAMYNFHLFLYSHSVLRNIYFCVLYALWAYGLLRK